ncbi:MAG: hypothetical protein QOF60_2503 [Actinomycetota bacterium]|jgi:hypothetical protein|nr:hypothetical protein [Actinomycetota bacterium]
MQQREHLHGDLHAGGITIRQYEAGDEFAIAAALDEEFQVGRTVDDWRWRFLEEPYDRAMAAVMVADGAIVGHVASSQYPVWIDGHRRWMGQGGDLVLKKEYRHRGILELLEELRVIYRYDTDVSMSFPVDRVVEIYRKRYPDIVTSRLPQWVRWRSAEAVAAAAGRDVPRVVHPLADAALAAARYAARRPAGGRTIAVCPEAGNEFDDLAERSTRFAPCIRVRDREYVQWRWFDVPGGRWTVAAAHEGDRLTGWVAYGVSHFDAPGRGHVADLLAGDHGTTRALLAFAADALEADGKVEVAFDCLDPRPWSRSAYYRAGFVPRGQGPNIMIRRTADDISHRARDLDNWYLTIGDSDLA